MSTNDLHQDYYNGLWARQSDCLHPHARLRLDYIRKFLLIWLDFSDIDESSDLVRPPKILDLGCGIGWLSRELRDFGRVTGVEPSLVGIKYAQAGNRDDSDIEFIHGAAATLLSAGRQGEFDLVVASEVIEHAQDQSSFLQEIHSLLTPKGYLILTTPRQEMKKDWEAAGAEQQPIENWLTREELFSLTKAAGFQIVKYDVGFVEFTNKGVYRLLLSEKVRIASNRWGLSSVLGWLHQRHALYQFLLLRKV